MSGRVARQIGPPVVPSLIALAIVLAPVQGEVADKSLPVHLPSIALAVALPHVSGIEVKSLPRVLILTPEPAVFLPPPRRFDDVLWDVLDGRE